MEITTFGHLKYKVRGKLATAQLEPGTVTIGDFTINAPGEYEVQGVTVLGLRSDEHLIFRLMVDGVNILWIGDLQEKLKDKELEQINGIDLLFVSTEGPNAGAIVTQVEPKVVLPMGDPTGIAKFAKELGVESLEKMPKFSTSKDKLPENLELVYI